MAPSSRVTFLADFLACTAYSRYMLDVGQSEDWLALQIALAPCLIGYGQIAARIYGEQASVREGNPYWKWVENYVAEDFVEAVKTGSGKISKHLEGFGADEHRVDRDAYPRSVASEDRRASENIYPIHRDGGSILESRRTYAAWLRC